MNKILSFFKKDIFLFILIVMALGFYFGKKTKSLKKQNYALYRESFVLKDEQKILNEYKKKEWESNGAVLNDFILENQKGSLNFYNEINLPVLIFCFNEYACPPCIDNYTEMLNLLGEKGEINIIGIYNSENFINYKVLLRDKDFKFKVYYYNQDLISGLVTESDSPYFILVDKESKVHDAKIGIPGDSLINPYFEMLKRKWFNKQAYY